MDVLTAIQLAARLAELAIKTASDAMPFIEKIKQWSADGAAQPTKAEFDELAAMEQPFLDQLNDRTGDELGT